MMALTVVGVPFWIVAKWVAKAMALASSVMSGVPPLASALAVVDVAFRICLTR